MRSRSRDEHERRLRFGAVSALHLERAPPPPATVPRAKSVATAPRRGLPRALGRASKRVLALALAFVLVDQLVQHVVLRRGEFFGRRVAPFDPPLFTDGQRASLERLRAQVRDAATPAAFDAELGWCPRPSNEAAGTDWAGARVGIEPLARAKTAGRTRVVAIGESFTYGAEVDAQDAWVTRLDRARDDLELANLAVGGYGLDQALLRLERDGLTLEPEEVWIGIVPGTAIRATTLYLPALRHWFDTVAFKPRFVLAATGALELVPNPARTPGEFVELLSSQRRFFDALQGRDVWIDRARGSYAPFGDELWHHSGVARLVATWTERTQREPAPWFEDGTRELERLVRAIVLRARDDCAAKSARLRVVLLPERGDLQSAREAAREYWSGLVAALRAERIEVLELRAALERAGGDLEPALWAPQGHYSVEGNRVVAEALLGLLGE